MMNNIRFELSLRILGKKCQKCKISIDPTYIHDCLILSGFQENPSHKVKSTNNKSSQQQKIVSR